MLRILDVCSQRAGEYCYNKTQQWRRNWTIECNSSNWKKEIKYKRWCCKTRRDNNKNDYEKNTNNSSEKTAHCVCSASSLAELIEIETDGIAWFSSVNLKYADWYVELDKKMRHCICSWVEGEVEITVLNWELTAVLRYPITFERIFVES